MLQLILTAGINSSRWQIHNDLYIDAHTLPQLLLRRVVHIHVRFVFLACSPLAVLALNLAVLNDLPLFSGQRLILVSQLFDQFLALS